MPELQLTAEIWTLLKENSYVGQTKSEISSKARKSDSLFLCTKVGLSIPVLCILFLEMFNCS